MKQDVNSVYGIASRANIMRIHRKSISGNSAPDYNYEDFCLPFALRLSMKLEDIGLLPEDCSDELELQKYIRRLSAEKNIPVRTNWFSAETDPGEFRDNDTTRGNIYALCAVLDADYEDCLEIWQKVFFRCPFLPKRKPELIYYYYAVRAYENGEPGSAWYRKGQELYNRICNMESGSGSGSELGNTQAAPPVCSSSEIVKTVSLMDEREFESFLIGHASTFADANANNEFQTARTLVRRMTELCWKMLCKESASANSVPPFSQQNDTLVDGILGFRQRGVPYSLSDLKLPKQFVSCFPSGKILGDIIGRSSESDSGNNTVSLDELSKMAVLLLFYYYHSVSKEADKEVRFNGFIDFANENLAQAGLNCLYPGQPYNSFMLYMASAEQPVRALRSYFRQAFERANREKNAEWIMAYIPHLKKAEADQIVDRLSCSDFYIRLGALYLKRGFADQKQILSAAGGSDPETALLKLTERVPLSVREMLTELSLIPRAGISSGLFQILHTSAENRLEELKGCGLIRSKGSLLSPDSMLNRFIRQCGFEYDRIRNRYVERVDALSMKAEIRGKYGVELATILAVHAPKYLYMKRADILLKASRLFSDGNADRIILKKALECGNSALAQQLKCMNRKKDDPGKDRSMLIDLCSNLHTINLKLGNEGDAERFKRMREEYEAI